MQVLRCSILIAVVMLLSCSRDVTTSASRGLGERILGNWATKDPGLLRGIRFDRGNSVTWVEVRNSGNLATYSGRYQLTGKIIGMSAADNIIDREVIETGDDFLVLQGLGVDSHEKPQRFTRE